MKHMKTSIDPEAIYRCAYEFDMGLNGRPLDKAQAMRLYEQAAELGHISAQNNLGTMYESGEGVKEFKIDLEKAAYWYGRSADQGNPSAMVNLGALYFNGKGVPVDYARARELFETAAALGSETAYKYLCKMYLYGLGVQKNRQKALDLMLDGMACARA